MKYMKLLVAAYVGGVLRHPHEGVLHVQDADADRLIEGEMAEDVSADFDKLDTGDDAEETVSAPGGSVTNPALANPHQSEAAATATETPPARRKAAASKE